MGNSVMFSQIMEEYGSLDNPKKDVVEATKKQPGSSSDPEKGPQQKTHVGLMQDEERLTGSVTLSVYGRYLQFAGGLVWAPIIILLLTLSQVAQGKWLLLFQAHTTDSH